MRSLLLIIVSVLNGDETITELPDGQLVAFQDRGKPINGMVDQTVLLKVARLQTLIVKEQEKAEIPEMEALKALCAQTGKDFATVMAQSMEVQEDATSNIMMLERLIVEIVRDACPAECERFGVRYVADISMRIFFSEAPQGRFMD
jgi:hypothetical protein